MPQEDVKDLFSLLSVAALRAQLFYIPPRSVSLEKKCHTLGDLYRGNLSRVTEEL